MMFLFRQCLLQTVSKVALRTIFQLDLYLLSPHHAKSMRLKLRGSALAQTNKMHSNGLRFWPVTPCHPHLDEISITCDLADIL